MRKRYRKSKVGKHKILMRNCIIVTIVLTISLSVGYSAFNTNVILKTKGNVKIIKSNLTLNSNNLIYDIEDVTDTESEKMIYSITDKVLTVSAIDSCQNDCYGLTPIKVNLEQGNTYFFSAKTDGTWSGSVEAFIGLNGLITNENVQNGKAKNFRADNVTFTPLQTGMYQFRFDVNYKGETHKFWDISISTNYEQREIIYGRKYGSMQVPIRDGYTFIGWFDDSKAQHDEDTRYKEHPLYYYADSYPNLYNMYGYDEDKLYQYYLENGKKQNHNLSQYNSDSLVKVKEDQILYAGWIKN